MLPKQPCSQSCSPAMHRHGLRFSHMRCPFRPRIRGSGYKSRDPGTRDLLRSATAIARAEAIRSDRSSHQGSCRNTGVARPRTTDTRILRRACSACSRWALHRSCAGHPRNIRRRRAALRRPSWSPLAGRTTSKAEPAYWPARRAPLSSASPSGASGTWRRAARPGIERLTPLGRVASLRLGESRCRRRSRRSRRSRLRQRGPSV